MRVAVVGGLAGPTGGGVWTVAAGHARVLRDRGHDVALLGGSFDGTSDTYRLHRPFPGAGTRFPWSVAFARAARREVRRADLVHAHLCRDFMTCVAVLLTPRRTPIVAQTHGMVTRPQSPLFRLFDRVVFRRILRRVAVFLVLTEAERTELTALGVTAPVRSIRNGLPVPDVTWTDPARPVGAFLGRLQARKQPVVFAEAAVASGAPIDWLVAGDDQGELIPLQRAAEGQDRFEIRGPLRHDEVLATLADVSFFVLPSLDEPYPMAALEALAVGTPMVLTEQSGISDVVQAADAALVVAPDVESVAAAMKRLAGDAELRQRLSRNARAVHAREWSLDAVGERLDDVYAGVRR